MYHVSNWGKFPDGTDCIDLGGFHPANLISGEDVILLCSFHNNDVTLSQFSAMIALLQSFITSLVVVLPFYPVRTSSNNSKETITWMFLVYRLGRWNVLLKKVRLPLQTLMHSCSATFRAVDIQQELSVVNEIEILTYSILYVNIYSFK